MYINYSWKPTNGLLGSVYYVFVYNERVVHRNLKMENSAAQSSKIILSKWPTK